MALHLFSYVLCRNQPPRVNSVKYAHLARVVAGNLIAQSKKLIGRGGSDASILQVSQGKVSLKDHVLFARQYGDLQALRAELRGREEGRKAKPSANCLQAIAQHARRWSPFGRMVKLATVLATDGTALVEATKSQEHARCWKHIFEAEHVHCPPVVVES